MSKFRNAAIKNNTLTGVAKNDWSFLRDDCLLTKLGLQAGCSNGIFNESDRLFYDQQSGACLLAALVGSVLGSPKPASSVALYCYISNWCAAMN